MFPAVLLNDVIYHVTEVVGVKYLIDPRNLGAYPWVQVLIVERTQNVYRSTSALHNLTRP